MAWWEGLTRNWADLEPGAADPRLRPLRLDQPPAVAMESVARVVASLPRWRVVGADPASLALHATHATRVWGFLDDVRLRFEPDPSGPGTIVTGRSQSRIGRGDLGQNARNLRELREAVLRDHSRVEREEVDR